MLLLYSTVFDCPADLRSYHRKGPRVLVNNQKNWLLEGVSHRKRGRTKEAVVAEAMTLSVAEEANGRGTGLHGCTYVKTCVHSISDTLE